MSYIRLVNVTKRFGNVTAVDNLNLEIAKGECFSMLGPSGCGKTTTLRMVAGFEDLDDGEIHVGDRLLSSRRTNHYVPPENRDFGMVFQAFAVWPHLSVYENVAFPLRLRKLPAAEIENRTRDALRHTNLMDVAAGSPSDLSGGGKQRVALARALAIQPDVMLLDEPLSSLDPHLREEMRFEIKDLQRHYGFSILYVTHDQSEAMALSDRIMVMKLGVVQQVGTPLEVYTRPANKFVFSFIGLSNFIDIDIAASGFSLGGIAIPHSAVATPLPDRLLGAPRATLASRPSEIDFVSEGGLPGTVTRRSYLGETTDYLVECGGHALRVQKTRNSPGPREGENCQVVFRQPHWYATDE
ncbi:ABC transporter ATP-binding protein [Uliginosibacterium sp. sgz301328]|uniref:ABC transporter ATP-binding protein n=1 Tax=Uliginosibacterium sp. sgz301328 TaxID=3243764 RepID=UPI00359D7EAA